MSGLTPEQNEILDLRDKVYDLTEELEAARVKVEPVPMLARWGVKGGYHDFLVSLHRTGFLSHDEAKKVAPQLRKYMGTAVVELRKRLKPHGVEIITRHGFGYEMPEASRDIITAAIERRDA